MCGMTDLSGFREVGVMAVASVFVLAATPAARAGGTIIDLGALPGDGISFGFSVSADGFAVAGGSGLVIDPEVLPRRAFRWTDVSGMQDLGTLGGTYSSGEAISADSSVVTGYSQTAGGFERAFRWTSEGGMQELGTLGGLRSNGYGISADGSVIVGNTTLDPEDDNGYAFRWTAKEGMQSLGTLGGFGSEAFATSADGSAVAGSSYVSHNPGTNPVHAYRWSSVGGMQDLGTLGGQYADGFAISADGSTVVGNSTQTFDPKNPRYPLRAFRWTAGDGMHNLGTLGGAESYGYGVSGDGSTVVGSSNLADTSGNHAYLWTASLGMVDLNTYLPSIGIDLTGWVLILAKGISADGTAITGVGTYCGATHGFLVRISPPFCPGDADGSGAINFADATAVLTNFGFMYAPGSAGAGDANNDGDVDFGDITAVLTNWGLGCP